MRKNMKALEEKLIEKILASLNDEAIAARSYGLALEAAKQGDLDTCRKMCKRAIKHTREDRLKHAAQGLYNVSMDPVALNSMLSFISRDDLGND